MVTMNPETESTETPLFPPGYRASGLLLHMASLPSQYGAGDAGVASFRWVDRLQAAGQSWWHALPLGPTGYRSSPCQDFSAFAASELLIGPDALLEDGLVNERDCTGFSFPADHIDYSVVVPFKHHLLEMAGSRFRDGVRGDLRPEFDRFRFEQSHWLDDYALFRALKSQFDNSHYLTWPMEFVQREAAALEHARRELAGPIEQISFTQFLLFRAGRRLKEYANARGIRIIGDLPFFVPPDSSDVWAHPELFLLGADRHPKFVAGVPADCCSSHGLRWGNPVYNWDAIRQSNYRWYLDRLRTALTFVDVVRLEHFRGFAAAWHVPAGAPTPQCGQWMPGPGVQLFKAVREEFGILPLVAEDLGMITADVRKLLDHIDAPGIRVLQRAFDGHSDNPHLPENYPVNSVVYTGNHDDVTSRTWHERLPSTPRQNFSRYLRRNCGAAEVAQSFIRLAWSCRAALAIAPLHDVLNLSTDGAEANWSWRCADEALHAHRFEWLREVTRRTNRMDAQDAPRRMEMAS
jgi:4-alpha-glucanotransferase